MKPKTLPTQQKLSPAKLSPAEYVIRTIGGVRATARALKYVPSAISKWRKPKTKGGTGGRVPTNAQHALLRFAAKTGISITPNDLILGR